MRGADVLIMSKKRKSYMNGAQYLHRPIPLTDAAVDPFKIHYQLRGEASVYRDKVYGVGSTVSVSPSTLVGIADAWDIRATYDQLWEMYSGFIQEVDLSDLTGWGSVANFLKAITPAPDVVLSTVPAHLLCEKSEEHVFRGVRVWATNVANFISPNDAENIVICSGFADQPWYRQSRVHGFMNTEYPEHARPPITEGIWGVIKPISHNCTCAPEILRLGRYGAWKKGVLAHEAFYDTYELLENI